MSVKFIPLSDNVLIKPQKNEAKEIGGIYLPEKSQEKPSEGEIVAIGVGKYNSTSEGNYEPMNVKVGDKVSYKKWGGQEVKINNEDYIVVAQSEILGII